ncbi:2Fe-2S ferredoxin-type domain-containing protein [Aphelenchoides besseyi]|nr:2Fe-2S ferredoxin-type domain-containing protein [Aphelenchoides besseyi]KAI6211750.1 2Fe-2S ferredoxin-type domain-containing protein [Aphelenchoides besseyi]
MIQRLLGLAGRRICTLTRQFSKTNPVFSGEFEYEDPKSEAEIVNLTYVTRDDEKLRIRGKIGDNVMYLAHRYDIEIEGACDAALACCTCHVYVDDQFTDKIPEPTEDEEDMLDMAPLLKPNSRLSCQIILNKQLEGLTVTMPLKPLTLIHYENNPEPTGELLYKDDLQSLTTTPHLSQMNTNESISDPVDKLTVDFETIMDRFNRMMLLPEDLSVHPLERRVRAVLNPDYTSYNDTVEEALEKLRSDIKEFEELYKQDNQGMDQSYLDSLRELLQSAEQKLHGEHQGAKNTISFSTTKETETQIPTAAELSDRLKRINERLGMGQDRAAPQFAYPLEVIAVELLFQISQAQTATSTNTELTVALNGLQEYLRNTKVDYHKKVDELYKILEQWNVECQILPLLVERLRETSALSEQIHDMLQNIDELTSSRTLLAKSISEFESNNDTDLILRELETISNQLDELEKKN